MMDADKFYKYAEIGIVIMGILMIIATLYALWVDTNGF